MSVEPAVKPVAVEKKSDELAPGKPRFVKVETPESSESRRKIAFVHSFTFEYVSDEDDTHYGPSTFTCKRLTLGDAGQVGVMKARLNGGQASVAPSIDWMHEMMAYLYHALTDAPDWWEPANFYDGKLLRSVYEYVRRWEDSFRSSVGERPSTT
jgi:hypothetical protein